MIRKIVNLMTASAALVLGPFVPAAHAVKVGHFAYAEFHRTDTRDFYLKILVTPDPAVVDRLSVEVTDFFNNESQTCRGTIALPNGSFDVTPDLSDALLQTTALDLSCENGPTHYTVAAVQWRNAGQLQPDSGSPQGVYRSTFADTPLWGLTDVAYLAFGVEP